MSSGCQSQMAKRFRSDEDFYAKKRYKTSEEYDEQDDLSTLPKEACKKLNDNDSRTDFRRVLTRKPDGEDKPFYVLPSGRIYVEAFLPMYQLAEDFLVSIAEPISRQRYCHQYQMTAYSLYAGASMGISTDKIIDTLDKFCKTNLPEEVVEFVRECTNSYGKLNVVLRNSQYYLESLLPDMLKKLLEDREIQTCLLRTTDSLAILNKRNQDPRPKAVTETTPKNELEDIYKNMEEEDDDEDTAGLKKQSDGRLLVSFEVLPGRLEVLQKRCMEMGYYPLAEYDFRHDMTNANINITLKTHSVLRPYQEKSLRRMFGSGRSRSGVIVLPCGAGKTLTGVAAACTINKRCLVLCTSSVAVEQWKSQFKYWSTATDDMVCRFTSDAKDKPMGSSILISTYSMITHSTKRSREAQEVMDWLNGVEWGLMILDEVQFVPAKMFRKVISNVHAHCKLGLTATLVREDDKIADLNFLIGPKLYEANWLQLQDKGYIAKVQCCEVACQMDPMFYREYLRSPPHLQHNLFVMNPEKFRICEFLIKYHERRGDKVIVFADKLFSLKTYAISLGKPYLCGSVQLEERIKVLNSFKESRGVKTIFVSKVADNSFDLPDANVLIQISNVAGSRRQEAQRLGRILRAKKDSHNEEYNAFFYSLVSQDTHEEYFAHKRQRFLVQQGYSYKFIKRLQGMEKETLALSTKEERRDLLTEIMRASNEALCEDDDPVGKSSNNSKETSHRQGNTSGAVSKHPSQPGDKASKDANLSSGHAPSALPANHNSIKSNGEPSQASKPINVASVASITSKKPEPEKKDSTKKAQRKKHILFTMFRK